SEEHTSELQSPCNLVCRLLLEKKNIGVLQFLPTLRVFCAMTLLFRKLAKLLVSLSFRSTDTEPGDNQRFSGVRGHCCKMNFSKVYCRVNDAGSLFNLWNFHAHMQFKAVIPHEGTGSTCFL